MIQQRCEKHRYLKKARRDQDQKRSSMLSAIMCHISSLMSCQCKTERGKFVWKGVNQWTMLSIIGRIALLKKHLVLLFPDLCENDYILVVLSNIADQSSKLFPLCVYGFMACWRMHSVQLRKSSSGKNTWLHKLGVEFLLKRIHWLSLAHAQCEWSSTDRTVYVHIFLDSGRN